MVSSFQYIAGTIILHQIGIAFDVRVVISDCQYTENLISQYEEIILIHSGIVRS